MTGAERRWALRKIFREFERRVRAALAEQATDAEKDERSFLWDPIAAICFDLGIARRKLSALTKELTGMAAHDVVDKIRAETIEAKISAELDGICRRRLIIGQSYDDVAHRISQSLKDERSGAQYDRNHFAISMGFSNYARMRRGCMLAHGGRTPRQIEAQLAGGMAEFYEVAGSIRERKSLFDNVEWLEERLGLPLEDAWAKAQAERPEWVATMCARLGGVGMEFAALAAMSVYARPADAVALKDYERDVEILRLNRERDERLARERALLEAEAAAARAKPRG